jgi:hypothetical protein
MLLGTLRRVKQGQQRQLVLIFAAVFVEDSSLPHHHLSRCLSSPLEHWWAFLWSHHRPEQQGPWSLIPFTISMLALEFWLHLP